MTTGESEKGLRQQLEKALAKALKDVSGPKPNPETTKAYTLTDQAKVWDRVLKLEAIKAKLKDGEWGAGFSDE